MLAKVKYNKGDIFIRYYYRARGVQEGSWILDVVTGKAINPKAGVVYLGDTLWLK